MRAKKSNEFFPLFVIFAIAFVMLAGWNTYGALDCASKGGNVQLNGVTVSCYLDFSNQ